MRPLAPHILKILPSFYHTEILCILTDALDKKLKDFAESNENRKLKISINQRSYHSKSMLLHY